MHNTNIVRPTDTGTRTEQTIGLTLDHPTREGDGVFEVLTDLPAEVATALVVSERYGYGVWPVVRT